MALKLGLATPQQPVFCDETAGQYPSATLPTLNAHTALLKRTNSLTRDGYECAELWDSATDHHHSSYFLSLQSTVHAFSNHQSSAVCAVLCGGNTG